MKKFVFILLSIVVIAAVTLFAAFHYYTPEPGTFDNWHKSFAKAKEDAQKRSVPMLVKIGAEM